jgi:hypothetical protein
MAGPRDSGARPVPTPAGTPEAGAQNNLDRIYPLC